MTLSVGRSALPPVLSMLLQPWQAAVATAGLGMGEHVTATAANAARAILRRIVPTPLLEHALTQARMATDALAETLDARAGETDRPRACAEAALAELAGWLMDAVPNDSTTELGLGWEAPGRNPVPNSPPAASGRNTP